MAEADSATQGARVLIVDDDATICRQMAAGLAHAGFQVVTAHDGDAALVQAEVTPPDVAVVDLGMPTSGLEVIRKLKEMHGQSVHVIVLTGSDDESSRTEAFDAGTDDFIAKPIPLAELRRRITAATRSRRAYVEARLGKEAADRRLTYGAEASALLAHDLNNGLAVALSNLSYLAETLTVDSDQRDALAATLRSLRRMSGLVANFVDVARFEDAAVKPLVTRSRVREVLASVMDTNASSINVTFVVDCEDTLAGRFDVALVERVLHNLVGNAARYCNPGGQIRVAGRRWHTAEEDSVELEVENTGPTIPEKLRGTLFQKYVRGSGGKRGMGLYFCRLVAEAHGGSIDYEATPTGPRFLLRLPGRA